MGLAHPLIRGRYASGDPEGATGFGKKAAEMKADEDAWRDGQLIVTSCAFCDWKLEAPAGEAREAARAHREAEHPEAAIRRPRRTRRMSKRALRSAEEEAQAAVDARELNRVRAEREDSDRLAKIERGRQRDALAAMDAGDRQETGLAEVEQAPAAGLPERSVMEEVDATAQAGSVAHVGEAGESEDEEGEVEATAASTTSNRREKWTRE